MRNPTSLQDTAYIVWQLAVRDFKIRYRNMTLGVLWSFVNPLIYVFIFYFVFTKIFPNTTVHNFPLFILCALLPFNFFSLAWVAGTTSVFYNSSLVKRVVVMREVIPVSTVMAVSFHFLMQIVLLLAYAVSCGARVSSAWLWIPIIIFLLFVAACGLALLFSALDVYVRDTRYVVESGSLILFWVTPIFYSRQMVPARYQSLFDLNPAASAATGLRAILLDNAVPSSGLMGSLAVSSAIMLGVGAIVFHELKNRFAEHL